MAHNEQKQFFWEIKTKLPEYFINKRVLDIGSMDINGTARDFFVNCDYLGIDVGPGKHVDIVCSGHEYNEPDYSFDVALSAECFEHNKYWKETFFNMYRLLKPNGLLIITCATTGRLEHGTYNREPWNAPHTNDYYKNLTESDFRNIFNFPKGFKEFKFIINTESHDLYFYGIKN